MLYKYKLQLLKTGEKGQKGYNKWLATNKDKKGDSDGAAMLK